jgi:acyl carrier protein
MNKQFIRDQLVKQIEKSSGIPFDETGCSDSSDLLKEGLLDSMAFLEIFLFIEKSFDVPIGDEDIANPKHTTLAGICKMVQEKGSPA